MCSDDQVQNPPTAIEAEGEDYNDDSGLGSDAGSSTASIGSSILKYRTENGRTYHSYKEGKYLVPNDEEENDRLDLQHHLYSLTFGHKLHVSPLPEKMHHVLDIGTGTGIWAIDFADEHPETKVRGIDLSPIQPTFIPPNLTFEIDDIEEPWSYSHKFDFIHSRMMTGSIADWPKLFGRAYENLNPGGWIQLSDMVLPMRSDDHTMGPNLAKWGTLIVKAAAMFGRSVESATLYKEQLIAAGFEDVQEVIFKWPMNRWPKDPKMKELGMWTYENIAGGLSGLSLALFTRALGWSLEELDAFLVDVKKEMGNTKIHSYFAIYVVYGKKPM